MDFSVPMQNEMRVRMPGNEMIPKHGCGRGVTGTEFQGQYCAERLHVGESCVQELRPLTCRQSLDGDNIDDSYGFRRAGNKGKDVEVHKADDTSLRFRNPRPNDASIQ